MRRKKSAKKEEVTSTWKQCNQGLRKIAVILDYFALLLVHNRTKLPSGKFKEKWFYLMRYFATTTKLVKDIIIKNNGLEKLRGVLINLEELLYRIFSIIAKRVCPCH